MTRQRLVETAIDQFGRFGFDGASTRDIAQQSLTAMSAITYHFGGKTGLYLAAADEVAACVVKQLGAALDEDCGASTTDRDTAIAALLLLLDSVAVMMMSRDAASWSQFIMREQQHPTQAFERLYEGAMRKVEDRLVGAIRLARADLTDEEARATGILLLGQAMILRVGRHSVLRMMKIPEYDQRSAALLRKQLRANAQQMLATVSAETAVPIERKPQC